MDQSIILRFQELHLKRFNDALNDTEEKEFKTILNQLYKKYDKCFIAPAVYRWTSILITTFIGNLPSDLSAEDLMAEVWKRGFIGENAKILKWDPERGKFSTFLSKMIRWICHEVVRTHPDIKRKLILMEDRDKTAAKTKEILDCKISRSLDEEILIRNSDGKEKLTLRDTIKQDNLNTINLKDLKLDEISETYLCEISGMNTHTVMYNDLKTRKYRSLHGEIDKLPEKVKRDICRKFGIDVEPHSYDEIAMANNEVVGTVKARISRGISKVKKSLFERSE